MHKRRLVTPRVVGMAMLLMIATTWGIFAKDGTSSTRDATTPPAASATKPVAGANDQITLLKQQMALQQKQIEQMQKALAEQNRLLEQLSKPAPATEQGAQPVQAAQPAKAAVSNSQASEQHSISLGEVASTSPVIPQFKKKSENAITSSAAGSPTIHMGATPGAGDESSPISF